MLLWITRHRSHWNRGLWLRPRSERREIVRHMSPDSMYPRRKKDEKVGTTTGGHFDAKPAQSNAPRDSLEVTHEASALCRGSSTEAHTSWNTPDVSWSWGPRLLAPLQRIKWVGKSSPGCKYAHLLVYVPGVRDARKFLNWISARYGWDT
jgi:hypothetical protein